MLIRSQSKKVLVVFESLPDIEDFRSKRGMGTIKDEDLDTLSEHINAVAEILKSYGK